MNDVEPIRILQMCSSNLSSGAENHVLALSKGLRARGHEVTVAVPPGGWLTTTLSAQGVPFKSIKMKDLDYWISIVKLTALVRRGKFDVLHAHLSRACCIAHAVGRLTGVTVIATAHVHNTARIYKRIARRRQNRVVAVSRHVADLLARNGVRRDRIATIYHGTDFANTPGSDRGYEVKSEFGIPVGAELVGLVGKICRDKGQIELVQALSTVADKHSNAHLLLVGRSDVRYEAKLREAISIFGLEGRVWFAGVRNDVPRLIDSFTLSTLPSVMETFGLAAIESSARGKAVVATREGALPEVIRDGETGILVDLDPSAIGQAISDLLSDPERRERMGTAGRELVQREFSIESMLDRTEELYVRTLRESQSRKVQRVAFG